MPSNQRNCPTASSIIKNDDGSITVTLNNGKKLEIPLGFQADCIDGEWKIVPQIINLPPISPVAD